MFLVASTGCRGLQVSTHSNLNGDVNSTVKGNVDSNVRADVHVNTPPQIENRDPLTAMTVVEGTKGQIAIIDVDGFMINKPIPGFFGSADNPVSVFREKLDQIEKQKYQAVILRINSPGGGVTATDMMWNEIKKFRT